MYHSKFKGLLGFFVPLKATVSLEHLLSLVFFELIKGHSICVGSL